MEENTTKADRWIDFLVPWNTAYYFNTRRMQTSIKVVILVPLILGLLYRALGITEKFIDKESTLGELFLWVSIWFAVLFVIYLGLAHTILTVAHDSIIEMILEWSKNRAKNNVNLQASITMSPSQENTKEELEGEVVRVGEVPAEEVVEEIVSEEIIEEPAMDGPVKVEDVVEASAETISHVLDIPDPSKLENYIRENRRQFSKGEDMAMLYDILQEKEVTEANLKDFHAWLVDLTYGVKYNALSEARKKLKDKMGDEDDEIMKKRKAMLNQITEFLI